MNYHEARDNEQLRFLDVHIAKFIRRYKSKVTSSQRRTLILFPGGIASQLLRARKAYSDNTVGSQTFQYDKVWLTPKAFLGGVLTLKMHKVCGMDRDLDNRIIIADDAIKLFGISPYKKFIKWCELNDLDWFIFGWDWRRRIEDTTEFFVSKFLPRFQGAVQKACDNADPLRDFILVGHSLGGMVINLIMRQDNPILSSVTRAVTVATPFYGYSGQIRRWFEGERLFNHLGPRDVTMDVIKTITSFPGFYALPYLDRATYALNRLALANDPEFPLGAYPSKDAASPTEIVDPFNPEPQRYPVNTGFDMDELNRGLQTFRRLVAAPPPQFAGRFFNIRGVQSATKSTPGPISWRSLPGPHNPKESPITLLSMVPGDDTQPAWSTRLVTLPADQCITVRGDINHAFIMEHDLTHQAIAHVL